MCVLVFGVVGQLNALSISHQHPKSWQVQYTMLNREKMMQVPSRFVVSYATVIIVRRTRECFKRKWVFALILTFSLHSILLQDITIQIGD